jgi:Family of unknown function (DUF6492)
MGKTDHLNSPVVNPTATKPALAVITPSYAGDLDRFALLCESFDRFAAGDVEHLVMVADHDAALFQPFATPRRRIIMDSQLLPAWLKRVRQPWNGRSLWISTSLRYPIWPMRGWHIQQIRKLLAARHTTAATLLMADSDTVFIRPVAAANAMLGAATRLFCIPAHIDPAAPGHDRHGLWYRGAADLLGLPQPEPPFDDYINNLVTWRRDDAIGLVAHIEKTSRRPMVAALGRYRSFSEYTLYGLYVAHGLGDKAAHASTATALGHTYWSGDALDDQRLAAFLATMQPEQIAFGVQSFTGTDLSVIRRALA